MTRPRDLLTLITGETQMHLSMRRQRTTTSCRRLVMVRDEHRKKMHLCLACYRGE